MKVSVLIITYNHEKYIAQAIESVLMQLTNFDYEIIIGEDDSDDRTRTIVKEYKKRYPDRIKLFLNDRKNVMYINGRPTGRWNFINCLKHARGEYVAILEGDDYWTSEHKLQKQVDFLEANPDFVICCHNTRRIYENDPSKVQLQYYRPDFSLQTKDILTIEDQIRDVISYHTSSVVFRNGLVKIPHFFVKVASGDITLFTLLAQFGKIKYLDEVMSVARKHDQGVSRFHKSYVLWTARINMNSYLDSYLQRKYTNLYKVINEGLYVKLLRTYRDDGRYYSLMKYVIRYLFVGNSSPKSFFGKLTTLANNLRYSLYQLLK